MSNIVKSPTLALPVRCWLQGGPANQVWNWGDAISPHIYQFMTGEWPRLLDQDAFPDKPHLMICGSTMKWINQWTVIWGIGEIAEEVQPVQPGARPLSVCSVRGPLTRDSLLRRGIDCPEIYGDPALLFPKFYESTASAEFELGIIPHYIDQDVVALEAFANDDRVLIIDITQAGQEQPELSFIDDVNRCKRIASSSLHGLIAADAYGVRSIWVQFSHRVFGGGFKFRDYFQSVGRPVAEPLDFTGALMDADDIIRWIDRDRYEIRIDQQRLIDACPFI